jgi:hypothetical protein
MVGVVQKTLLSVKMPRSRERPVKADVCLSTFRLACKGVVFGGGLGYVVVVEGRKKMEWVGLGAAWLTG